MAVGRRAEMMEENREKLIVAARKVFAEKGFSAAPMEEITAAAGLTRGALYHNFGDKTGLLAAVVARIDGEMAARGQLAGQQAGGGWDGLMAEGRAYIELALEPEVQRIVLRDGPAVLGDPSQWPSQNACLAATIQTLGPLVADGTVKPVDIEGAARLMNGAALNAALWVATSDDPQATLPRAVEAFRLLALGYLAQK